MKRRASFLGAIWLFSLAVGASVGAQEGKIEVLWLGQAATKITTVRGKVIVIDPFLTQNPKTPPQYKNLDALGKVDLILVTHAHGDHLGDGPQLAKRHNVPLWGPAGLNQSPRTLGILPANLAPRMNKGGVITPLGPDIKIVMIRAEHSSELLWVNPVTGKEETHVGGEPVGFIIEFENGFTLYHMGDTGIFADMQWIGEYYQPDVKVEGTKHLSVCFFSISQCVFLLLSVDVFLSVCVSLSVCVCVCFSVCICVSVCVCVSASVLCRFLVSRSLSVCVSLSVFVSLSQCV